MIDSRMADGSLEISVAERGKMESNRCVDGTVVSSGFDYPCSTTPRAFPGDRR